MRCLVLLGLDIEEHQLFSYRKWHPRIVHHHVWIDFVLACQVYFWIKHASALEKIIYIFMLIQMNWVFCLNYFNAKKVVKIIKITKGKCDMKMKYKGGNLTGITACYKYVINIISKSLVVCRKNIELFARELWDSQLRRALLNLVYHAQGPCLSLQMARWVCKREQGTWSW